MRHAPQETVYILGDLIEIGLPSLTTPGGLATGLAKASTQRIAWEQRGGGARQGHHGPGWRFGHSMVVAPKVSTVQADGQARGLRGSCATQDAGA